MADQKTKTVSAKAVSQTANVAAPKTQVSNENASAPKKENAKKAAPKKSVIKKKVVTKKPAEKKKVAAKAPAKKASVKKVVAKKSSAKKIAAKKPVAKKVVAKKPTASKAKSALPSKSYASFIEPNQTMEKLMSQGKTQMDKIAQQASEAGRENIEAVIKSSTIFAKGFEDIMRTAMSMAQDTAERQSKFVKEVLSAKTLNEWTEMQNKIAQTNFDDFVSGATKISEMGVKVLTDCVEPINDQVSKGIQQATKTMAA